MKNKKLENIKKELPPYVTLLAVSKSHTKEEIDNAYACGYTIFGESKVQELKEKYDSHYSWHMIGHLQRNKVKDVIALVDMIQSLDSLRLAQEIHNQCRKINKVMPVLVEINISREPNKMGIMFEECLSFIQQCNTLSHIDIQGIMCVGPRCKEKIEQCFKEMEVLFHMLQSSYGKDKIKFLSMGMSDDYNIAIKYGSTMIRLGTSIFGKRMNKMHT